MVSPSGLAWPCETIRSTLTVPAVTRVSHTSSGRPVGISAKMFGVGRTAVVAALERAVAERNVPVQGEQYDLALVVRGVEHEHLRRSRRCSGCRG